MLSTLRGVLKVAWRLGQMTAEDHTRATDVESISGSALPRGSALTNGEIAALLGAYGRDGPAAGARDAAMIALLCAGGRTSPANFAYIYGTNHWFSGDNKYLVMPSKCVILPRKLGSQ